MIILSDPWGVWFLLISIPPSLGVTMSTDFSTLQFLFRTLIYNLDSPKVIEEQVLYHQKGVILLKCPLWPLSLPTGMLWLELENLGSWLEGKSKEENTEGRVYCQVYENTLRNKLFVRNGTRV